MNSTPIRGERLLAILAVLVGVASGLMAGRAWAEGSRSLYPATYDPAGSRANMEVSGSGSKYVGQIARRTFLYVYAETGEYILTGSRNRSNGGDIRIFNPQNFGQPGDETVPGSESFSCDEGTSQPGTHFAGAGRGTIDNRSQELAGPDSADGNVTVPGGFRPCAYQAPTSGIFGVLFTRASSGGDPNGSVSNPAVSDEGVSAWDVTVRANATSTTDLNGRLFTFAFVGDMGSSGRRLFSDLYYVTSDGYRYRQTFRGLDPIAFALFANTAGFLDQGNPLYRDIRGEDQAVSVLPPGITSQPAQLPIFFSDISPGTPGDTEASKVLGALGIPSNPPPPGVQQVRFRGSLGVGATTVGAGGNFDFLTTNTFTFEIVISRDGVDFSPTKPQNRVLRGTAGTGPHTILWDGRDNINGLFPVGDFPFTLTGRNGEAHFPFVDAEGNANGGPTIRKLTGVASTIVFYDDRGYVTSLGQSIGIPNGLLCGQTPPTPPTPDEALAGVDSNAVDGSGRYYRHWPGNRSENEDCDDDAAFGDTKGLDLWVFEGTTALQGTLSIFDAPDFTDVGTSVAVPLVIFPGATVFGTVAFRNDGLAGATGVGYSLTLGTSGNRPASVNFPTLSGSDFSYNSSTGVVTFSGLPSSLTPGQQISLPFNYVAPQSGIIPAVATISAVNESAEQTSPNTANGVTIIVVSDVRTTVAVPPTAGVGSLVTGQVTFGNSATATALARGVTYSLTIGDATLRPAAVTFTNLPPGVTANYAPGSGVVTFTGLSTTLGRGEVLTVIFEYVAPAAGTIPVNSAITTTTPETTAANNTASGPTSFVAVPDLTIAKAHSGNFTQGQTGATFTITVTNLGPGATLRPVVVHDTLPTGLKATGLSGPGWLCIVIALRCARADALAGGASYPPITLTVDVAPNAPPTMTNVATVSGGGEANTTNNTATDPITVIPVADLTIAKSHSGTFTQGQVGATYTISVTNLGPGATTGTVTVTDTLPTGVTATAIAGPGWTCVLATLTCTRGDALAAGASYPPITLTVNVALTATGTLIDSVVVSGGGELNTTNNNALDPAVVTLVPDLAITKSHVGNFKQGQTGAQYTIVATNVGSAATTGTVTVTDTLPAGLTATAIAGPGWNCTLAPLSCSRADALAPGASYPPITLTVDVALTATGTLVNPTSVSGGGEANLANNTATDPVTILPAPDLALTKSKSGDFVQGGTGTFTIVVSNVGTVPSSGPVLVTDVLPAGLTATSATGPGWACTTVLLACARTNALAPGASYPPITIEVNVTAGASGTLINTATVSGGGDTNPANNTGSVGGIAILIPPDLTIDKSHTGTFFPGQTGTYTIIVRNISSVPQTENVTVADILPSGLTATAIAGPGWSCSLSTLRCTRSDDLAPGASYPPITVTVMVSPTASGELINRALVFSAGESSFLNNAAQDRTEIGTVAIPTLSFPMLLLLAIALGLAGRLMLRRAL